MTTEQPYTPDDEDIFIAHRFWALGLMKDPDSKPHDPVAQAEADAAFKRWLDAHDAQVRRDAAREAWTDCVSEASALGWLHAPAALDMLGRNPHEETP